MIGYRAPNALVGGWMLDSLEKMGFKYDSSVCINSLYNKMDAAPKNVSTYPYYPMEGSLEKGTDRNFTEYPWAYYDLAGFKIPTTGGPMLRFLGSHMILRGLRQSLKRGDTVFYFHSIDISNERFPQIGRGRPFYWAIKGNTVEKKIRHILNGLKEFNMGGINGTNSLE